MKILCTALNAGANISLYHTGPALDHGPLPSIFYFALSGPDSLTLDPFNQPVQFLQGRYIRFFSLTLPAHEAGLSPHNAISLWAEDLSRGIDVIGNFLDDALRAVDFAVRERLADPHKLAAAGLSRGGFIALHLAAREPRLKTLCAFAPLTRLEKTKEFASLHLPQLDLFPLADALSDRRIRFYIGNQDTRVDTRSCFDLAMHLAAHSQRRSPPVEMIISPSVGQMGHGTPPEIFRQGAEWLAECLK